MKIGHVVQNLRSKRQLTQRGLALKLAIDASHISLIEAGRRIPSIDLLERLSIELEVPLPVLTYCSLNEAQRERIPTKLRDVLEVFSCSILED